MGFENGSKLEQLEAYKLSKTSLDLLHFLHWFHFSKSETVFGVDQFPRLQLNQAGDYHELKGRYSGELAWLKSLSLHLLMSEDCSRL
jgi:hypothetical protein